MSKAMSMYSHRPRTRTTAGFTIVELMIATLVFSMVLLLITIGVLSFTRSYYKGINQSNTQNAARTIQEAIAQAIQFSGDTVTSPIGTAGSNGSQGFCIGNQRFSYALGWQLWDEGTLDTALNQTRHALVVDKPGNCGGLDAQDVRSNTVDGTELLQPRMRLSKLSIERIGTTDMYRINIRVVYGDNDLLDDPTGPNASCKTGQSGSQYCAQAELTTVVKKRITQ
jgi:type II secretory pathway pseudopilin PulG